MASERQIAANRRNAARSTGPRTASGKVRSSKNALRHGFAAFGGQSPMAEGNLDLEALADRLARIEAERGRITFLIETRLWEGAGEGVDDLLHELDALERYARRSASALRKK